MSIEVGGGEVEIRQAAEEDQSQNEKDEDQVRRWNQWEKRGARAGTTEPRPKSETTGKTKEFFKGVGYI
jgi:hypothetical protein